PGDAVYNKGKSSPKQVLSGVSFAKYGPRYLPDNQNLPTWRYTITDEHTPANAISVDYRVLRNSEVILDWVKTPPVNGDGFNRAIVIHGGLAPSIAQKSGDYTLEVRARDQFGNERLLESKWHQEILAPAVAYQPIGSGFSNYNLENNRFSAF